MDKHLQRDEQLWTLPPEQVSLLEGEVHVWRVPVALLAHTAQQFQQLLDAEEVKRAERFYFEKDRRAWIVARAVLRSILGRYVQHDPRQLRFRTNAYGKPALAAPLTEQPLQFNLSHSGSLALYAVACGRAVGVDIEQMRDSIAYKELASRFFSERERRALDELPATVQQEAFFQCWSRKEAYIKAQGKGLSLSLQQFDVSLDPRESARLIASREEPEAPQRWSLCALFPGTGYAGALVVEGTNWQLRCWQWPE